MTSRRTAAGRALSPRIYRVVIVEDHALARAGLRTALNTDQQIEVVGEAANGLDGFRVIDEMKPDVAVIDIGLPGIDGIELTRRLRASVPQTHVVIVTAQDRDSEIISAIAAGADAYCVKTSQPSDVLTAVKATADGGAYFDPKVAHVVLRMLGAPIPTPTKDSPLTPRELQILRLIAEGVGNLEIAERLRLSVGTVKDGVHAILKKMSAADRAQAAVNALRHGFI